MEKGSAKVEVEKGSLAEVLLCDHDEGSSQFP
jgi:hypothetical protein